ncbi:MAG: hypothetical protein ACHQX4_06620 [Gemmatimonadales bacterium]
MTRRGRGLDVLDHLVHVAWTVFAVVGMFTLVRVPGNRSALSQLGWPIGLGLLAGVLTSPSVLRWIRPRLHQRHPNLFEDPTVRP